MLPDKGADVNVLGGVFDDALQAASVRGYDTIVQMPLDNGADVRAIVKTTAKWLLRSSRRSARAVMSRTPACPVSSIS